MNTALGGLVVILLLIALPLGWQWLEFRRARKARGRQAPEHGNVPRDGVVLLYFHSPRCLACKDMTAFIREWGERDERIRMVDIGVEPDLSRAFGVRVTPAVVVVRDGCIEEVLLGAQSVQRLGALLG
ncbi:MAG: thioredoxin family protein [Pseudomonadota bacterium]